MPKVPDESDLKIASDLKINIPSTLISNDLIEIKTFMEKYNAIIAKPIKNPGAKFTIGKYANGFSQHTNVFTMTDYHELCENSEYFQPTLFQEYIEKDFEIRTFYLKDSFFSMAIFSQKNLQTKVDYRNYDTKLPNRNVPYKISTSLERKLSKLMIRLGYDSGSIDLIYNKGNYYFLEINPVGQFEWVSSNCNYYLEKKISQVIINEIYEK